MTSRARTGVVLSAVVLALAGCSDSGSTPTGPTPTVQAPTPAPPPPSTPTTFRPSVTLSGVVFEETATGRNPIQNVWVYCEPCTADTHAGVYTDSNGFYNFTGVWTNGQFPTRISVHKDGYVDPSGLPTPTPPNPSGPGWREVVIDADTRFDIQLVRQ